MGAGRNHVLDGMRGCAAILVLLFHLGSTFRTQGVAGGYLAVDFFFILSGFVVTRAYEARLRTEWSFSKFVEVRLIRLYPLYFIGAAMDLARQAAAIALHDPRAPHGVRLALGAAFNLFVLPIPFDGPSMFVLNPPGWSLSLELAINLAFGAVLFRAPRPVLWIVAVTGAALMIVGGHIHGSIDAGVVRNLYYVGVGRTVWGFTIGILLARHGLGEQRRMAPVQSALLMAVLAAALVVVVPKGQRLALDLALTFVAFPAVVALAANLGVGRRFAWICAALGDLSFALYATHFPLLPLLQKLCTALHLAGGTAIGLSAVACIGFAAVMVKLDKRVRRWINERLHMHASAPSQAL